MQQSAPTGPESELHQHGHDCLHWKGKPSTHSMAPAELERPMRHMTAQVFRSQGAVYLHCIVCNMASSLCGMALCHGCIKGGRWGLPVHALSCVPACQWGRVIVLFCPPEAQISVMSQVNLPKPRSPAHSECSYGSGCALPRPSAEAGCQKHLGFLKPTTRGSMART